MSTSDALLSPATRLGTVALTVKNRAVLAEFYGRALGLRVQLEDAESTSLGFGGEVLIRLVQDPNAVEAPRHAELYHFCVAVEQRADLGWWLRRLTDGAYDLQGLVDHRMAEAIYLQDPEGNGIELNCDRPRDQWRPWSEWLAMGNAPLDSEGLLEANEQAGPRETLPTTTRVGHVHLHVADLKACEAFYCAALGLSKTAEVPGQVIFTAAGGYHHHFAFNVWKGRGIAPQPLGAYGIRYATLILSGAAELDTTAQRLKNHGFLAESIQQGLMTRDPSGHVLHLIAAN